uniref:Zinc-ribbon domain-containing protein n=1 Tax=Seriola dumerili TaxID=41447 RepID=A0A3B4ULA5_SERDU
MFCPECGNQAESSYKFCPQCGLRLLSQNRTQDVATSAPQPSVADGKSQKEDQDQVPKDVEEKQENAAQMKGQLASDDSEPARDDATPQDLSNNTASTATVETRTTASESISQPDNKTDLVLHLSVSTTAPSPTPASDKLTRQQTENADISTEASPDAVQIPADKSSDIHSGLLSNATSSHTSTAETGSTAPEPSQQTRDLVTKHSGQDEDKTTNHETQNLSGRPDDNEDHTNTEQHTFAKQSDRNKDQAAGDKVLCYSDGQTPKESKEHSADPCPATKETAKSTETIDPQSDDKTSTHLERQEQQPVNRDVDVSSSPASEEMCVLVEANTLEGSTKGPLISSNSDYIQVYFHAVTSKELHLDPEKDFVCLNSGALFGNWKNGQRMYFSRRLEDKRYLVEGRVMIHKDRIHEVIPYKYAVYKQSGKHYKQIYEALYQEEGNEYINRCLSIRQDLLTHKGEWHQYDDMIHPKMSSLCFWQSTKGTVLKGREEAGKEMLKIIFDLLTTWNEQNVENFFFLLRLFCYAYSQPLLHDGMKRPWGLPYGKEQVKTLLKCFLEENINPEPSSWKGRTESFLPPLHAGVVGLLVYNKYLKESMTDQLSSLCDLLRLPRKPQHHFISFWEDFVKPLPDKESLADAVEMLCSHARHHNIEKWVLVIPLIHLLRGESKPFEPVPLVLNPQFDSWTGFKGSKGTHSYRDSSARYVSVSLLQRLEHKYGTL